MGSALARNADEVASALIRGLALRLQPLLFLLRGTLPKGVCPVRGEVSRRVKGKQTDHCCFFGGARQDRALEPATESQNQLPLPQRLRVRAQTWQLLDSWAGQVVTSGAGIEWESGTPPPANKPPPEIHQHALLVDQEVQDMLSLGAIRLQNPHEARFFSRVFVVPKAGGKVRPVIDFRELNKHVKTPQRFKCEGWQEVANQVTRDCLMTRLDLTKAYLHISMSVGAQPFLCFTWRGVAYTCVGLPFGLKTSPHIFTKMMRVAVGVLRSHGIQCVVYMDDLLLLHPSLEAAQQQTRLAIDLLTGLGWSVNMEKSELQPKHSLRFLGFVINSHTLTLHVTKERLDNLTTAGRVLLANPRTTARKLAGFLGQLVSTREAVQPVFLHTLQLSREKCKAVRQGGWRQILTLSAEALDEVRWAVEVLPSLNATSLTVRQPKAHLWTDASDTGWGGVLKIQGESLETWGYWGPEEFTQHINTKEAKACLLAVQTFKERCRHLCIRWHTDSTVAYHLVRRWKSRCFPLLNVALQLWQAAHDLHAVIQPEHNPGVTNCEADRLSRMVEREDWKLNPDLFRQAVHQLGFPPEVDGFATRVNTLLPRFWSLYPQPGCDAVDAFQQNWVQTRVWANPPFSQIGRVLALLKKQRATCLLLAPEWPTQPWWHELNQLSLAPPFWLPQSADTFLPGAGGSVVPHMATKWRAAVFLVSGHPRKWKKGRTKKETK